MSINTYLLYFHHCWQPNSNCDLWVKRHWEVCVVLHFLLSVLLSRSPNREQENRDLLYWSTSYNHTSNNPNFKISLKRLNCFHVMSSDGVDTGGAFSWRSDVWMLPEFIDGHKAVRDSGADENKSLLSKIWERSGDVVSRHTVDPVVE